MRGAVFALVLVSSGCFRYHRVDTATAPSTEVVRVELTDAGSAAITPSLGEGVQLIEGPVLQNTGTGLQMDVRLVRRRGEKLMREWPGESIMIPASNIRGVSVKTVDRKMTTAALIGGTAAAVAIVYVVARATSLFSGGGKVITTNIR